MDVRLGGSDGLIEDLGGFGIRQALDVAKHNGGRVARRQPRDGLCQASLALGI
jgi:hypothetical protein